MSHVATLLFYLLDQFCRHEFAFSTSVYEDSHPNWNGYKSGIEGWQFGSPAYTMRNLSLMIAGVGWGGAEDRPLPTSWPFFSFFSLRYAYF